MRQPELFHLDFKLYECQEDLSMFLDYELLVQGNFEPEPAKRKFYPTQ